MKRRFVAINHNRKRIMFILTIVIIGLIVSILSIKWFFSMIKNVFKSENEQISLLNYGISNIKIIDLNLINPNDILSVSLYMKKDESNKLEIIPKDNDNPLVYIYNTHDSESYKGNSVSYASRVLKEELLKYGIPSFVENKSVSKYLEDNAIKNGDAFSVSRKYIDEYWKETETLKYFIDIHVSNGSSEVTSTKIGSDSYAKILFVVSMENKFYERTLEFASTLNSMLDKRLSRGIMKNGDKDNFYNQDMDAYCLLIEVGGYESNKEEIDNTLKIFGEILYEYMSEGYNGN